MNVFYVSTRAARCWGFFRDRPCWGITYKKVVALIEALFLFPISLMILVSCIYQFVHLLREHHAALTSLMTPVCYSNYIQDTVPMASCKDMMRLDWVCNESMMKVLLLGVFAIMDCVFVLGIVCYTWFLCCVSMFRIACCCCGCLSWKAACNRPTCLCGPHHNCGVCMSWIFCHGPAYFCCYGCWIPIVLTLYFVLGMFGSLLVYSLLFCFFACTCWGLAHLCKLCISLASFGRCFILPTPSFVSEYSQALTPRPSTFCANSFGHDEHFEKQKVMAELYGENHDDTAEWDIDEPGYESRVMGTPCPPVLMMAMPMFVLIIFIPLVVVMGVAGYSFIYQDYLNETLAWAESDMRWFYTDGRMGPGTKMWSWCWQVFTELFFGLTDAFKEIFEAWWLVVKSTVTFDSLFFNQVASFLEHGVNPANLFQTDYFFKFRQGVIFWRFLLSFVFAAARSIAMINMPFTRFMDMRSDAPGMDLLREWDMPSVYDQSERVGLVDPYDPYGPRGGGGIRY